MKILFTIATLKSGGAERVLTTLANFWAIHGHDVVIIKLDDANSFYNVDPNITIVSLNIHKKNKWLIKKIIHNLKIVRFIRQTIQKYNPDIVLSFMTRTNIYSILSTCFINLPIIISERNNYDGLSNRYLRCLRRILYPFSDGLVVQSQYNYDKFYYVKHKKIIFNPNWIVEKDRKQAIDKKKIIFAVGRLVKVKRFDWLIQLLNQLDRKILKNWRVFIAGDGEEKAFLMELTQKYHLSKIVTFMGEIKDIVHIYQQASIFISLSKKEGFPNALAEAMALGCACIATDCESGPSELIENNQNGFLIPVDNFEMAKEKLVELINNESLRYKYSIAAQNSMKRFNLIHIVKEWEMFIQSCQRRV
jgi:GalNAc-alpha-(1->4)-GalNAc-alpha-(1->3)-diNAcBac-PP-undecaprenol alpha-1,4-N-acetyl-D-galactosaminyltransferase